MKNERAMSESIGVVLMIGLVVVFVAVIAAIFLGLIDITPKSAFIAPDIEKQTISGKNSIRIYNKGGDTATLNVSGQGHYVMGVYIDSSTGSTRAIPLSQTSQFRPGDTIYVYNSIIGYQITNNISDLSASSVLSFPSGQVGIRLVDEKSKVLIARWDGSIGDIQALSVISITPNSGYNTSSVTITDLIGTGFQTGTTVNLNRTSAPDIPATSVTVVSYSKISCIFNLNGVAPGPCNVVVKNTNGQSTMLANGFMVYQSLPAPVVTSIAPNSGDRGWPVTITNLVGTGFQPGAIVKLVNSTAGPDITATNVAINPAGTSLTCTFDLSHAPPARRNVTVTNPDGKTGTRIDGFAVNSNAPTISKSTPSTGAQAATVTITDLAGHFFQPGAIIMYSQGATSIPLSGINAVNATSITGTLAIPFNAPTGSYNVTVTNTDGKTGTRPYTFTVTSNAPTLSNRTPTTGNRGWPQVFMINGSRFQPGATVTMTSGLKSSPVTDVNVVSATQITCTLDLLGAYVPADTSTGYSTWDITVTNPDGKSVKGTAWFSVYSYRPTIVSSLVPNTGSRGSTVHTSIPGTYFQPGATAYLYRTGQPNINAVNVNAVSPSQITCDFPIPLSASTGLWNIRVTNDDGRNNTRSNVFNISV